MPPRAIVCCLGFRCPWLKLAPSAPKSSGRSSRERTIAAGLLCLVQVRPKRTLSVRADFFVLLQILSSTHLEQTTRHFHEKGRLFSTSISEITPVTFRGAGEIPIALLSAVAATQGEATQFHPNVAD